MTQRAPLPLLCRAAALGATLATPSCATDTKWLSARCQIDISEVAPTAALPGESVQLTATPLSKQWDTAIYVGSARALVLDVTRDGCDECDTCREDEGCTECSDCDACDALCATTCFETAPFEVPDTSAGQTSLRLFNNHGESRPVDFVVLGPDDTGADDTGADDTSTDDTSADDSGADDTGADDTSADDTSADDTSADDSGADDTATSGP